MDFNESLKAAISRNIKVINKSSAIEYLFTVYPRDKNGIVFPTKFIWLPGYFEHTATNATAQQKATSKKEIEGANEINAQLVAVITAWTLIL